MEYFIQIYIYVCIELWRHHTQASCFNRKWSSFIVLVVPFDLDGWAGARCSFSEKKKEHKRRKTEMI